jgi:hypothetical protein
MKIATVLHHYLHAALWTAELDNRDIDEISPPSIKRARQDVKEFLAKAKPLLKKHKIVITDEQMGHDFWLSRNGHGAGFFDKDLGGIEDELQKLAKGFKEINVFGEDADKIIIE